jgi:pyruvate ferredoxin oxidoreductase alpha subunit
MMKKVIEGSMAVAEAVKVCRPHVISAYPITPQTHIVENLSQMVADGELKSEFINVESEFAAASVILGASATGARAYSTLRVCVFRYLSLAPIAPSPPP